MKQQQTDIPKRVRETHWNQSYLSVRRFCFLMFGMLLSLENPKHCWYIGGSKQHINPNYEANQCIGIYLWSSQVQVSNHIAPKKKWHFNIKISQRRHCLAIQCGPVQTNIIKKELDVRKHFCLNFFVAAIKINSFITFRLLHDLLYRQDSPNKWFGRGILSILRKVVLPGWSYCSNSRKLFGY